MSNRQKTVIVMFAYLFLNSVLFGAIFSRPLRTIPLIIGLICGMIAQILCLYLISLIEKTDP